MLLANQLFLIILSIPFTKSKNPHKFDSLSWFPNRETSRHEDKESVVSPGEVHPKRIEEHQAFLRQPARPLRNLPHSNPTVPPEVLRVLQKWLLSIERPTKQTKAPKHKHKGTHKNILYAENNHLSNKIYERNKLIEHGKHNMMHRKNKTEDHIFIKNNGHNQDLKRHLKKHRHKRANRDVDAKEEVDEDAIYDAINKLDPEQVKIAFAAVRRPHVKPNPRNCCFNGGTCYRNGKNMWCVCTPQFTGQYCESDVDECKLKTHQCPHHSTCVNTFGSYNCTCNAGFVKVWNDCIPKITCEEDPCLNGGICVEKEKDGSIACICKLGFRGKTCELTVPECEDTSCAKNEICVSTEKGFQCVTDIGQLLT